MRTIRLKEETPLRLDRALLDEDEAEILLRDFPHVLDLEYPTPRSRNRWVLTSRGYIGSIPLSSALRLILEPKTLIAGVFRMLEYAYDLRSLTLLPGTVKGGRIEEVYSRIADLLARRVLDRARRGLHRAYIPRVERLATVRGSIDITHSLRTPLHPTLVCRHHERTADLSANGILLWTLHTILRHRVCTGESERRVQAAARTLRGLVSLQRYTAADIAAQSYTRLNEDYRILHALCRFFLENSGPTQTEGEQIFLPFLIDMPRLYESYVAGYLASLTSPALRLDRQRSFPLGGSGTQRITLDLELLSRRTGETRVVLDTKYKVDPAPSASDMQQVVAYAVARRCSRAVLIYPEPLRSPFDGRYGEGEVELMTCWVTPDGEVDDRLRDLVGAGEKSLQESAGSA